MNTIKIKKIITGVLVFGFIIIVLVDALLQGKKSYSSTMGMDINRVYFYTFFLLTIGCWLLYHRWFVGIGFLALAAFSSYFREYLFLHNYFASILIYVMIVLDVVLRREVKWFIAFLVIGIIQGIAFQTPLLNNYFVGSMECLALSVGTVFVIKNMR